MVQVVSGRRLQLRSETHAMVANQGGVQQLAVDAGPAYAGQGYFIIGSAGGVTPGFLLQGVFVPLNVDSYTALTVANANGSVFQGTFGVLDGVGRASAQIVLPPLPALHGLQVDHVAVFADGLKFRSASSAVPLTLVE